MKAGIKYFNELASFVDPHTVECVNRRGQKTLRTAKNFLISVGGRPSYGTYPGGKEVSLSLSLFYFFLS